MYQMKSSMAAAVWRQQDRVTVRELRREAIPKIKRPSEIEGTVGPRPLVLLDW